MPDGYSSPIPSPPQSPASIDRPGTEHIESSDNYEPRITRSQDQRRPSADISPPSTNLPGFQEQVFVGDTDLQTGNSLTQSELVDVKQPTPDIQIGRIDGSLQAQPEEVDTENLHAEDSAKTHDLRSRTSPVPPQTRRGQKRRAADSHADEPSIKAPKSSRSATASRAANGRQKLTNYDQNSQKLSTLKIEPGDIVLIRDVGHQLGREKTEEYNEERSAELTYFKLGGENFCVKWRPHIVTKRLVSDFLSVPLYTHNGQGVKNKSEDELKRYVSIRDTAKFPLDDPRTVFRQAGDHQALLLEKLFEGWESKDNSTAKLVSRDYSWERKGLKVGKITKTSLAQLLALLKGQWS